MTQSFLSSEWEEKLCAELNIGEKLLWAGQPIVGRAGCGSLPLVLFGIPFTVFSVFWTFTASGLGRQDTFGPSPFPAGTVSTVFTLFGIPFILVGLWMLTSPLWINLKVQQAVYALTDKRALILSPGWGGSVSVHSIPPEYLAARTRTQNSDGSGTILFTRLTTTHRSVGRHYHTYQVTVGFANIPDVREVDALIERTYGVL